MDGIAEEPLEQGAGRAELRRPSHLAENLALAGDERVEARGDAEEMERGGVVVQAVEGRKLEENRCGALLGRLGVFGRQVELGAVAGREADGFPAVGRQRARDLGGFLLAEGDPLAHLHGRETMRRADEDEGHEKCTVGRPSRTAITSANPARRRYAALRPCQPAS